MYKLFNVIKLSPGQARAAISGLSGNVETVKLREEKQGRANNSAALLFLSLSSQKSAFTVLFALILRRNAVRKTDKPLCPDIALIRTSRSDGL